MISESTRLGAIRLAGIIAKTFQFDIARSALYQLGKQGRVIDVQHKLDIEYELMIVTEHMIEIGRRPYRRPNAEDDWRVISGINTILLDRKAA